MQLVLPLGAPLAQLVLPVLAPLFISVVLNRPVFIFGSTVPLR